MNTCDTCKHWSECEDCCIDGVCRRFPPGPAALLELGRLSGMEPRGLRDCSTKAHTTGKDWCGEWKAKVNA